MCTVSRSNLTLCVYFISFNSTHFRVNFLYRHLKFTSSVKHQDSHWYIRHESTWEERSTAPNVLNNVTRRKWVISLTPRSFNPEERDAGTTWIGGRVGPRDGSGLLKTRKLSYPYRIRILSRPVHSFITILTMLPRLPLGKILFHIYIQILLFLFGESRMQNSL
jgi:hypothetical protein